MLNWLSQHENIVTMALWVINALILLALAGPWLEKLHYEKQHRVHLRMAARAMARLAVFDSWVRAGGRNSHLAVMVEKSLREDYVWSVRNHGDEYYESFKKYMAEAERELEALLNEKDLPLDDVELDTDECAACGGTGYKMLEHEVFGDGKVDYVKVLCEHCHGKGFIDLKGDVRNEEKS